MTAPMPAVLRTLARLSAAEQPQQMVLDLSKVAGLAWLGAHAAATTVAHQQNLPLWRPPKQEMSSVRHLAAFDALHREDRLLRLGWAFLCGPAEIAGARRRVCLPLLSRPIRLEQRSGDRYAFHAAGDLTLFPLVTDWAKAGDLEVEPPAGQPAEEWIRAVLAATALGEVTIVAPDQHPREPTRGDRLVVVAGAGLHAGEPVVTSARGSSLYAWAKSPGIAETAIATLYQPVDEPEAGTGDLIAPLPLSPSQQAAIRSARTAAVTVIGGPPGSGKTHTLAALALDAVAASRSVLLASRTRNAADVLGSALRDAGGPTPVLFGDSELRQEMARELGDGLPAAGQRGELAALDRTRQAATSAVARVERAVGDALRDETLAASAARLRAIMPAHRLVTPKAFVADADLARMRTALDRVVPQRKGFLASWRARKLRRLTGASREASLIDIEAALRAAEENAAAVRVAAAGGTNLAALRGLLAEEDTRSRSATAAWLAARAGQRPGAGPRRAVAALATALRSGRAARRDALAVIDSADLVAALPLWVGTLADVEDILPPVAGMFDLVVIDEASHVDQPLAAPALLRGRRAVISGDPRQLRHVSFVSEQAVREAVTTEGTESIVDKLNVPKVSLFDAAAAGAGVHWLTEHHRCAPHLIGFAANRFYDGRIELLTTHPAIADIDCIDVERVTGARDKAGVNAAEVDAVVEHLHRRVSAGVRSIGVASPFRAQADALERALLGRLSLDEITAGGVRVGTVHGLQGSEFDEVVISVALTDADTAGSWRFANDPNLLAVLTTRARRLVHVISSAREPVGLIGEYLRHAETPPWETQGVEPTDEWTGKLSAELAAAGRTVRTGYPVGQWRLDLVVGEREAAVAVETRPHPDGLAAHLSRWRALHEAGWRVLDAFPSRFDNDPVRAAIELAQECG